MDSTRWRSSGLTAWYGGRPSDVKKWKSARMNKSLFLLLERRPISVYIIAANKEYSRSHCDTTCCPNTMFFYFYLLLCFIWTQLFGFYSLDTAIQGLYDFLTDNVKIESALLGSVSIRPILLPVFVFLLPLILRYLAMFFRKSDAGDQPPHHLTRMSTGLLGCYSRQFVFKFLTLHLLPYLCILLLTSGSIAIWHVAALPLVIYHGVIAILSI